MAEDRCTTRHAQLWLGTLVEIAVDARPPRSPAAAIAAAFAAVARVHRALSLHDPQSELAHVNRNADAEVQPISLDLRAVLSCALELASRSDGAFDPTVGGVREIGVAVGIRSTATVHEHLVAPRRKGLITQENRRSRTLRVVKP